MKYSRSFDRSSCRSADAPWSFSCRVKLVHFILLFLMLLCPSCVFPWRRGRLSTPEEFLTVFSKDVFHLDHQIFVQSFWTHVQSSLTKTLAATQPNTEDDKTTIVHTGSSSKRWSVSANKPKPFVHAPILKQHHVGFLTEWTAPPAGLLWDNITNIYASCLAVRCWLTSVFSVFRIMAEKETKKSLLRLCRSSDKEKNREEPSRGRAGASKGRKTT